MSQDNMELKELSIDNILKDFGINSRVFSEVISIFESILGLNDLDDPIANDLIKYYRDLYKSYGYPFNSKLVSYISALHTYITLISKLFTYSALCVKIRGGVLSACINTKNMRDFINDLEKLENGEFLDGFNISNFPGKDAYIYSWYIRYLESDRKLRKALELVIDTVSKYNPLGFTLYKNIKDIFGELYQELIDKRLRRLLGEFYTPQWLSDLLVSEVLNLLLSKYSYNEISIIDPMCGSGSILLSLIKKFRNLDLDRLGVERVEISGFEVNKASLILARSQYIMAILDTILNQNEYSSVFEIPIYSCDILDLDRCNVDAYKKYNVITTNPPWINWEDLSRELREKYRDLWIKYGLIKTSKTLGSGLGGSKRDLSTLLFYIAVDNLLKDDGVAGFIITQSVFKSIASEGFRRFKLPDGTPIQIVKVHDFSSVNIFKGALSRASIGLWIKGYRTMYPVDYILWIKNSYGDVASVKMIAYPLFKHSGVWLTIPEDVKDLYKSFIGRSGYRAYSGLVTAANSIYWIKILEDLGNIIKIRNMGSIGKKKVISTVTYIEKDLVFPLIRGRDLYRWGFNYSNYIILPSKPNGDPIAIHEMVVRYPYTYKYFTSYIDDLVDRSGEPYRSSLYVWREVMLKTRSSGDNYLANAFKLSKGEINIKTVLDKKPFYYIFNTKNIFSPYKVAWRYITRSFYTAVLGEVNDPYIGKHKIPIPDCKLMYIPTDSYSEAHYISAILNSTPIRFLMKSIGVETQMSVHLLNYIKLDRFDERNDIHRELSKLSIEAHRYVADDRLDSLSSIEHDIDLNVAELYNVDHRVIDKARKYLKNLGID